MMIRSTLPQNKEALAKFLPHQGAMVLLDSVESMSEQTIVCRTRSHRLESHPLLASGALSVYAGVEYAAQAMALHNALSAGSFEARRSADTSVVSEVRQGVVAVASKLEAHTEYLDGIDADLYVAVSCLDSTGDSRLYEFELNAEDQLLLTGRLLVMLV